MEGESLHKRSPFKLLDISWPGQVKEALSASPGCLVGLQDWEALTGLSHRTLKDLKRDQSPGQQPQQNGFTLPPVLGVQKKG